MSRKRLNIVLNLIMQTKYLLIDPEVIKMLVQRVETLHKYLNPGTI
ncbi:MAG: hypothetical protein ACC651_13390 [Candidatus Scalindua sp.]